MSTTSLDEKARTDANLSLPSVNNATDDDLLAESGSLKPRSKSMVSNRQKSTSFAESWATSRSRTASIRYLYSQTSIISQRAGHAVMRFLKRTNGVGIFLGLLCALMYSLGGLIVKILNNNYQMHPFLLSSIRHFFLIFFAAPQVKLNHLNNKQTNLFSFFFSLLGCLL